MKKLRSADITKALDDTMENQNSITEFVPLKKIKVQTGSGRSEARWKLIYNKSEEKKT